jgi:integrase
MYRRVGVSISSPYLGSVPAAELDSRLLERYIDARREEHASNASINRELAYQASPARVPSVPHFPHLKENNARQGFVTPEQFATLVDHCPDLWLRALLETGYNYGWRVSELLNLRIGQVDLVARTIRLAPGTTKNMEGREVTIESGALLQLIRHCVEGKATEDHVFTRGDKPPEYRPFSSMTYAGQRRGTCALPEYRRKSSCASRDGRLRASLSDTRSWTRVIFARH